MQKLIVPAAEVLAMDATDFSCGDRLLKGMGKTVRAVERRVEDVSCRYVSEVLIVGWCY